MLVHWVNITLTMSYSFIYIDVLAKYMIILPLFQHPHSCLDYSCTGDQLNESIFLPPFSVIFEQSKTFNFWEFIEFFLLILSGWMIGVFATHFYYFGFNASRKVGYKEVPMNDLSSDEEGTNYPLLVYTYIYQFLLPCSIFCLLNSLFLQLYDEH